MPSEAINEICAYPGCSCAATDVLWIVTKPKRSVDGTEVSPESSEPKYYDSGWSDDAVDMAVMSTTTRGQSSSSLGTSSPASALRWSPISDRRSWHVCEMHSQQLSAFLGSSSGTWKEGDLLSSVCGLRAHHEVHALHALHAQRRRSVPGAPPLRSASGDDTLQEPNACKEGAVSSRDPPPEETPVLAAVYRKSSTESPSHGLSMWAAQLVLCAASTLVFYNSIHGDLCYDDHIALGRNLDVTKPGWSLWRNDFWGNPLPRFDAKGTSWTNKSYRPLTVLSFRWNYFFVESFINDSIAYGGAGGLSVTWPYHVTNILLHVLVTLLVHRFALTSFSEFGGRTERSRTGWCALLVGMLFAVHPIHSEAVANIAGRSELLSALFGLIGLSVYGFPAKEDTHVAEMAQVLLGSAFVWLAGLSKESGLTIYAVFIIRDVLHLAQPHTEARPSLGAWLSSLRRKCSLRWSLTVLLAGISIGARLWLTGGTSLDMHRAFNKVAFLQDFTHRAMSYAYCHAVAFGLLVWPAGLSYSHDGIEPITALVDWRNLRTFGFWLIAGGIGFWYVFFVGRNQSSVAVLSAAVVVFTFLPASQILFPVGFLVAERTLYLPSVGLCLLVVDIFQRAVKYPAVESDRSSSAVESASIPKTRMKQCSFIFLATSSIACLGARTLVRNEAWNDDLTLRKAALSVYPNSRAALHGIGHHFLTRGKHLPNATALAEHYLTRAFEIDDTFSAVSGQLGMIHFKKGNMVHARFLFEKAANHNSEYATNVGCLHIMIDQNFSAAASAITYAANNKLGPADSRQAFVLNNLGVLHTHPSFAPVHHAPAKAISFFLEARATLVASDERGEAATLKTQRFKSADHPAILRNIAIAATFDSPRRTTNEVRQLAELARAASIDSQRSDAMRDGQQRQFEADMFAYLSAEGSSDEESARAKLATGLGLLLI
jgi:hypothetical protein